MGLLDEVGKIAGAVAAVEAVAAPRREVDERNDRQVPVAVRHAQGAGDDAG